MQIKLKGYGGHGWKVCDSCPCGGTDGCFFGYEGEEGRINVTTGGIAPPMALAVVDGKIVEVPDSLTIADGWIGVTVRPQICIDEHGK